MKRLEWDWNDDANDCTEDLELKRLDENWCEDADDHDEDKEMKMSVMSIKESFSKISWMILSFYCFAELFSYSYSFVSIVHVCDNSLTQTSFKDRKIYNLDLICKFWLKSFNHLLSFCYNSSYTSTLIVMLMTIIDCSSLDYRVVSRSTLFRVNLCFSESYK